jgi:hypothetical protein
MATNCCALAPMWSCFVLTLLLKRTRNVEEKRTVAENKNCCREQELLKRTVAENKNCIELSL